MYYQRAIQLLSNHYMTTVPKYFANFGAKHKVLVVIPNDETSKMCWDNKRFHCDGHTSSLWALHSFLSWISHHASILVSFCACTFGTKSPNLRISFTCQPSLVSLVPRHKEEGGERAWFQPFATRPTQPWPKTLYSTKGDVYFHSACRQTPLLHTHEQSTISESHSPKEGRPRCYTSSPLYRTQFGLHTMPHHRPKTLYSTCIFIL